MYPRLRRFLTVSIILQSVHRAFVVQVSFVLGVLKQREFLNGRQCAQVTSRFERLFEIPPRPSNYVIYDNLSKQLPLFSAAGYPTKTSSGGESWFP